MSIVSSKTFKRATNFAFAFVVAVSTLTAAMPFIFSSNAAAAPSAGTETVQGNTTAVENTEGWMFNRDPSTSTPFEFNADEAVIGDGSLYVKPISASAASDKFVAENFLLSDMADINTVSYDYKIGAGGVASDYDQMYMNVYANYASSAANKFYDCRYTVLATSGSTSNFTTLTFDTGDAYSVATRNTSPFTCPPVPEDMDLQLAGSTIRAFSINVGDTSLGDAGIDAYLDNVRVNSTNGLTTYDLEPVIPACSSDDTTFDTFSNGSVNGQNGWESTGPFDQEVVTNDYGINSFGCKSLRLSNSVTYGSFGDQTFSYETANEAGEADATSNGQSGGTRQTHYEAQFDIASTQADVQTGLSVSVSPDRGDGSRMSYLRFVDGTNGIEVYFDDVQAGDFVETYVGILQPRTTAHTIKFEMDFVDGPSNDVVKIYIDGALAHTGTSWEDYYRFDPESSAEQTPRAIDSLLFRVGGSAVPANDGKGFLFDNVEIATSTPVVVPPVDPTDPTDPVDNSGSDNNNNDNDEDNTPPAFLTPIITNPGSVLGNETDGGKTGVDGATDTKTDQQKGFDGTIAGIAWYWWLLALAVLGGASWWIAGAIRRRNDETSSSK